MTNLIVPEGSTHWYWPDGRPAYQMLKTDGTGYRGTTIRDARKYGLLPSVTSILGVLHKPGLEAWKANQYILSALTLTPELGESQDEFARRVVQDGQSESRRASDFGTRIHALVEWWVKLKWSIGEDVVFENDMTEFEAQIIKGVDSWMTKHEFQPVETEFSFANEDLGFGGKLDCLGWIDHIPCLIDWKTQGTRPGEGLHFYPEWNAQLGAYKRGIYDLIEPIMAVQPENLIPVSVVISSTEPGRVQSNPWFDDWGYEELFLPAFKIWKSPFGPGYSLRNGKE